MGVTVLQCSSKSEYAIKALVCLARGDGGDTVQAREIVAFTGIPPKYLDQVMHALRHGGLVESKRGAGGGYVLARGPEEIRFLDVIELIDGSHGGKGRMQNGGQADLLVAPVWDEARECLRRILHSATIADAAARASAAPMYHI